VAGYQTLDDGPYGQSHEVSHHCRGNRHAEYQQKAQADEPSGNMLERIDDHDNGARNSEAGCKPTPDCDLSFVMRHTV
jgi:hypothetical protein